MIGSCPRLPSPPLPPRCSACPGGRSGSSRSAAAAATACSSWRASSPVLGCAASTALRDAIREAVARVGLDPEGRVAFKRGDPRSLPYPDGFFDLVAQTGGGLHLGEIARVLRPAGHLALVGEWRWLEWRLAPPLRSGRERRGGGGAIPRGAFTRRRLSAAIRLAAWISRACRWCCWSTPPRRMGGR